MESNLKPSSGRRGVLLLHYIGDVVTKANSIQNDHQIQSEIRPVTVFLRIYGFDWYSV